MFIDYRKNQHLFNLLSILTISKYNLLINLQILVLSSIPRILWKYSLIVKFVNLIFNFSVYGSLGNHYHFLLENASLVLSIIDYCILLLSGLPEYKIRPLERIICSSVRVVYNIPNCEKNKCY